MSACGRAGVGAKSGCAGVGVGVGVRVCLCVCVWVCLFFWHCKQPKLLLVASFLIDRRVQSKNLPAAMDESELSAPPTPAQTFSQLC